VGPRRRSSGREGDLATPGPDGKQKVDPAWMVFFRHLEPALLLRVTGLEEP
jgi:hypothetical protein